MDNKNKPQLVKFNSARKCCTLEDAIKNITEDKPSSFIVVYKKLSDQQVLTWTTGHSLEEQLGMCEIAKAMILRHT